MKEKQGSNIKERKKITGIWDGCLNNKVENQIFHLGLGPDMLHITFLGSYFLHCLVSAIKTEVKVS